MKLQIVRSLRKSTEKLLNQSIEMRPFEKNDKGDRRPLVSRYCFTIKIGLHRRSRFHRLFL